MTGRLLAEQVYQALKRDILTCTLRPAQPVYEGELAERYGVSKTPIREALNTLRQEGYVQVIPRRGYMISPISVQDVQQVFSLRLLLEPYAAELAAQRVTGEELRQLKRLAQRSVSPQRAERSAPDRSFHLAIAEASGNSRLAAFIGRLLEETERLYHLSPGFLDANSTRSNRHLDVVQALMQGDPRAAREIMTEAIQDWRPRVLEALLSDEGQRRMPVLIDGARTGSPRRAASDRRR